MLITEIHFCILLHIEVLVITLLAQGSRYSTFGAFWGEVL